MGKVLDGAARFLNSWPKIQIVFGALLLLNFLTSR